MVRLTIFHTWKRGLSELLDQLQILNFQSQNFTLMTNKSWIKGDRADL